MIISRKEMNKVQYFVIRKKNGNKNKSVQNFYDFQRYTLFKFINFQTSTGKFCKFLTKSHYLRIILTLKCVLQCQITVVLNGNAITFTLNERHEEMHQFYSCFREIELRESKQPRAKSREFSFLLLLRFQGDTSFNDE